ncbi:L-aspartate oxidase, partial [Microbacterium sp. ZW T2_14]
PPAPHSATAPTPTPEPRILTAERWGSSAEPWDDAAQEVPVFSRAALQELMWKRAGLVRDENGLRRAASVLAAWQAQRRVPVTENDYEDQNLLLVAAELVAAARARRGSVGAHFRADDPTAETPQNPDVAGITASGPLRMAAELRNPARPVAEEAVAC